jgi:hypothetical protein
VYVHADLPLPEFLFNPAFTKRLGLNLTLTAVNKEFIGAHTGFVVELHQQTEINNAYTFDAVLAVIAELSAASAAPIVSKTAKQRARWIRAAGGGDASL